MSFTLEMVNRIIDDVESGIPRERAIDYYSQATATYSQATATLPSRGGRKTEMTPEQCVSKLARITKKWSYNSVGDIIEVAGPTIKTWSGDEGKLPRDIEPLRRFIIGYQERDPEIMSRLRPAGGNRQ